MSWRPGEEWFDVEVLWFRERAGVPVVAGLPSSTLRAPAAPNGLSASRRRRAESKRRRHLRRIRAAVVVLSPALIVPVAGLRAGGGGSKATLAEDPPTLTLQRGAERALGERAVVAGATLAAVRSWPQTALQAERRARAAAVRFPPVEWHHATSVGLPYDGHLIDGTQLPIDGANWVTWDPVTDSVPNAPNRLYGNERTIRTVISVIDAYRAANPGAPRVVVGDISLKGGGPMTDEHVSHQNGLDVDVYYPRLDRKLSAPVVSDQIDLRLSQDLVNRFVAAGAQLVLVGFSTGLHGPAGVVLPYANHEYHMHVRFPAP